MHFFANFHSTNSKTETNFWSFFGFLNRVFKKFCQFILIFSLVFGIFGSLPIYAAENGVIGFSDCNFGSAEKVRKDNNAASGNETIRKCFQQILTFIFVLGIFLIGMRIALEAFKNLNPAIQGNSIDNSVKLGKDVVIGLILIGAPSLFLGLFNEAALQLPNLFDLGKFATNAKPTSSKTPGSGGTTNPNPGGGTPGTPGGGTPGAGGGATTSNQIYIKKDVNGNNVMMDIEIVKQKITEYNKNPVASSDENRDIVKSLLANCLTRPEGNDRLSCSLIKDVELKDNRLILNYDNGSPFRLPRDYKITNAPLTATSDGKNYTIQMSNDVAKITVIMSCDSSLAAQQSLLTQNMYKPDITADLNPAGCNSTITPITLKI